MTNKKNLNLHETTSPPKMKIVKEFRDENTKEVGFKFVDYYISEDKTLFQAHLHYDQLYTVRSAELSPYALGLLEGKIMGTKCPKCGDVFFPPRVNCWNLDCKLTKTEWIELPQTGKVHTYTIAGWSGRSSLKRLPFVLAYVILDGVTTAVANEIREINPWNAEFNMLVKVKFVPKEQRVGAITDFYFVPADDWKPSPMNPEKERIKKLCEPVYKWVASLK
ncbi:MAG: Zn-ribbon domain-containing OB-fold protein [Candidatus Helarchaeota archaeon]